MNIVDIEGSREVPRYANYDLHSISSTINADKLEELLVQTNYNIDKTKHLVEGFRNGFSLGYRGPIRRMDISNNIPFMIGDEFDMWEKVMKEVELGRYAGPYDQPPFKYFIQSPVGLVPKAGGKMRLIFHLSYDFKNGNKSVNAWTPANLCKVKYHDLDHAIANSLKLGQGTMVYAKTDLVSAFRALPLSKKYYRYLLIRVRDPITKKWVYMVDKNLPFGSSISCSQFQKFSDGLRHIVETLGGCKMRITNYLDDFLFYAKDRNTCNRMVRCFLQVCQEINFPVAFEKTVWGTERIIFLGCMLDGIHKRICVPEDKRKVAMNMINHVLSKKKATVRELQRLSGYLNFLCKAVVPGRTFTRRMYAKFNDFTTASGIKLQHFHHVRLDKEFKWDCLVWKTFLEDPFRVSRPFIDLNKEITATTLNFYSDASGSNDRGGFGVLFNRSWISNKWERNFIRNFRPSIEYLELYALCVGIYAWGHLITNARVRIFCDNESVCNMVNNEMTSNCKNCMYLLRMITLKNLLQNRRIFAEHIFGFKNICADALSRSQIDTFIDNAPEGVDETSTPIPEELWPVTKIWLK